MQKIRCKYDVQLLFTESLNTWVFTPAGINMLFTCNYDDAGTHIVLSALRS